LDHDYERLVGITDALAGKLTGAFELAVVFEKEARSAALLRKSAHRIAMDARHLRSHAEQLQSDLMGHKARS
jgi:hypothetical protein